MASDNLGFISYNINEIHQSSKRAKIFEYLKNRFLSNGIVFFFFFGKRHTAPMRMKTNEVTILKEKYFTLMVQQILAVSQLLFLVQNL